MGNENEPKRTNKINRLNTDTNTNYTKINRNPINFEEKDKTKRCPYCGKEFKYASEIFMNFYDSHVSRCKRKKEDKR